MMTDERLAEIRSSLDFVDDFGCPTVLELLDEIDRLKAPDQEANPVHEKILAGLRRELKRDGYLIACFAFEGNQIFPNDAYHNVPIPALPTVAQLVANLFNRMNPVQQKIIPGNISALPPPVSPNGSRRHRRF